MDIGKKLQENGWLASQPEIFIRMDTKYFTFGQNLICSKKHCGNFIAQNRESEKLVENDVILICVK